MHPVATQGLEHPHLCGGFHALGDRGHTQRVGQVDQGPHDADGAVALRHRRDEAAVDLDLVDLQRAQPQQRRVAGAEVVEADRHAQLP